MPAIKRTAGRTASTKCLIQTVSKKLWEGKKMPFKLFLANKNS